uniref:AP2/ERF domain-containing protein n=1 Tax=Oryza barthii TaxID=65489 RepID=A0A0D3HSP9_9ORYZ
MEKNTATTSQLMTSSVTATPSSSKRPAARTKFQETRHPVFRGGAAAWVRVLGRRGCRLWLARSTASRRPRAHDAAMLALCGASASLDFADSAWLLHVPLAPIVSTPDSDHQLPDVQRAASKAIAEGVRTATATATSGDAASTAPPWLHRHPFCYTRF